MDIEGNYKSSFKMKITDFNDPICDNGERISRESKNYLDRLFGCDTDKWYKWASRPANRRRLIRLAQEQDRIDARNRQEGVKSSRGEHSRG